MGFIWLTGMNAPDHVSIWRFFNDNKKALEGLFEQTVRVAWECNLLGLVVQAVDGTKVKASCSGRGVVYREDLEEKLKDLDESISEYMKQVALAEREEVGEYRLPEELHDQEMLRESIKESLDQLKQADRKHMSPVEPDARLMKNNGRIEPCYNAQVVADDKSGIIVAQEVVTDENDTAQLVPMLERVEENLGQVATQTLADGGYASGEQLFRAEEKEYAVLTKPSGTERRIQSKSAEKAYHTSHFIYDEEGDRVICPQGEILTYERTKWGRRKKYKVRVYRCHSFRDCPFRDACTKDPRGRMIEISPYHGAVVRQREKRRDAANKELIQARSGIVEPVFAWVKRHLRFRRFTVAGLENVRAQWCLICTTINLKKLYKQWLNGGMSLARAPGG
jgi:hypothetical protein